MTNAPNRLSAQLTLAWDGATLRVEGPGRNGSRRKIEGALFDLLQSELKADLIAQLDEQRVQNETALRQLQNQNILHVAQAHGRGVAAHVWHNGELAFNRTWRKHLSGEAGNLNGPARSAQAPKSREAAVDNTTLDKLHLTRKDLKEGLDL
jgi:hypothetical protein